MVASHQHIAQYDQNLRRRSKAYNFFQLECDKISTLKKSCNPQRIAGSVNTSCHCPLKLGAEKFFIKLMLQIGNDPKKNPKLSGSNIGPMIHIPQIQK